MTKAKQKLKPDVVLKKYWRDNGRFADLFNAVLFGGRQVIRPEELEDVDTVESSVMEHGKHVESIQAVRDNMKVRKRSTVYGTEFVMLGNEGQEHIHYAMPMRVMGYDYGSYKKQYDSNAEKCRTRDGMEDDEYLSRMKKNDKFAPVITVVVYYGEKPWDAAVTLHGMLQIPPELKGYVNDYKILLVEARNNDLFFHNGDNADLFQLLGILLDKGISRKEAREKAIQYSKEHQTDRSVIMTVAGVANARIDYHTFQNGGAGMYSVFEDAINEGKAEGIIESCFEFGLSEEDIRERLQRKLNISFQAAQKYMNEYKKQTI